ncbi:protein purity of essence [Balamuthia mandrillaris]
MTKNPYSSAEVGPLMRDVKNRICEDLELHGLLEDDNGMELLVDNKIIKLDLPVVQVYEQVWRKAPEELQRDPAKAATYRQGTAMEVVYRLQGLDGEATEEIVEQLQSANEEEVDPEEEFKITAVMHKCGGLEAMLTQLQRIVDFSAQRELVYLVCKLLMYCCKLRVNRQHLLKIKGTNLLLETLQQVFPSEQEKQAEIAHMLLQIIEGLVLESNRIIYEEQQQVDASAAQQEEEEEEEEDEEDGMTAMQLQQRLEENTAYMQMFLDKLFSSPMVRSNPHLREAMTRIMPSLIRGEESIMELLYEQFEDSLDLTTHDQEELGANGLPSMKIRCFVQIVQSTAVDEAGHKFRSFLMHRKGLTAALIRYVKEKFPMDKAKDSEEWTKSLSLPALPHALNLLNGLVKGHDETQRKLLEEGVVALLHQLEGISSTANNIGTLAENLLNEMLVETKPSVALRKSQQLSSSSDGTTVSVRQAIEDMREATRQEKRRQAQRHREEVLRKMKLGLQSNTGAIISEAVPESIQELQEETGFTCMVCREGYTYKPEEALGFYTFSMFVRDLSAVQEFVLVNSDSQAIVPEEEEEEEEARERRDARSNKESGYTTVTHFNLIHLSCHRNAARAGKSLLKQEEWDGATLRNQNTKTNSLFPILGPAVPVGTYKSAVNRYWKQLHSFIGGYGSSNNSLRFRLLCHDLKFLLHRFGLEASFSTHSKGGGRDSNIKFLPFMLQMGLFLLDYSPSSSSSDLRKSFDASFASFLQQEDLSAKKWGEIARTQQGETDDVYYFLVLSLFLLPLEEWERHKTYMLKRVLVQAFAWRHLDEEEVDKEKKEDKGEKKEGEGEKGDEEKEKEKEKEETSASASTERMDVETAATTAESSSSTSTSSSDHTFRRARKALIFFSFVHSLQQLKKKAASASSSSSSSESSSSSNSPASSASPEWAKQMANYIRNNDQEVVKECNRMLEDYEEMMLHYADFQEYFDELGVLDKIFGAPGVTSCEQFVSELLKGVGRRLDEEDEQEEEDL